MSKNNFDNMNPMYGVYGEIEKIIKRRSRRNL